MLNAGVKLFLNLGCLCSAKPMDERTRTRKRRLQELIDEKPFSGNRAAFAEHVDLSKGRITQLLDPEHSFGELAARKLALTLMLPSDYFDSQEEPARTPQASKRDRLELALAVLTKVLQEAEESVLMAVKPLLSSMADDPANAKNKSLLILKLLVTDGDKTQPSAHDELRQSHIFAELGDLNLGDGNGQSDSAAASGRSKK